MAHSGEADETRPTCDLCEAARITPWFYEDDVCWIAECEFCAVPMVVWRTHDAHPPQAVKSFMHDQLGAVVKAHFGFVHFVDDNMRNIPDHYHAHARRRGGFFSLGATPPMASDVAEGEDK
jgi:hypothetical protein